MNLKATTDIKRQLDRECKQIRNERMSPIQSASSAIDSYLRCKRWAVGQAGIAASIEGGISLGRHCSDEGQSYVVRGKPGKSPPLSIKNYCLARLVYRVSPAGKKVLESDRAGNQQGAGDSPR